MLKPLSGGASYSSRGNLIQSRGGEHARGQTAELPCLSDTAGLRSRHEMPRKGDLMMGSLLCTAAFASTVEGAGEGREVRGRALQAVLR